MKFNIFDIQRFADGGEGGILSGDDGGAEDDKGLTDGLLGLLATDRDNLLRLVVVEASITAHLDVDEDVRLHELGHEQ